jgi:hypothetical protein
MADLEHEPDRADNDKSSGGRYKAGEEIFRLRPYPKMGMSLEHDNPSTVALDFLLE